MHNRFQSYDSSHDLNPGQDINVLALVKGKERYIFIYNDENRAETLRTFGEFVLNPELSFNWYDAAVLSQRIRQDSEKFEKFEKFEFAGRISRDISELTDGWDLDDIC